MNKFVNVGNLYIEEFLSQNEKMMVHDSVRRFVDNKIKPIIEKQHPERRFSLIKCSKAHEGVRVMHKLIYGDDITGSFFACENKIETTLCGLFCL
jgi:hypothetical protein